MPEELLSENLKIKTLASHQQLEKVLVIYLKSMRSKEDYIHILQFFYSYFSALEHKISLFIGTGELPDLAERRKSGNLILDLKVLNGRIPVIAGDSYLPEINSIAQAFGALYVMEGSTLGGQIIVKMIEKELGLSEGVSFFKGYGAETFLFWTQFKQTLDIQPDHEAVIQSADATFAKFSQWISNSRLH
jgi:heme oxygenase